MLLMNTLGYRFDRPVGITMDLVSRIQNWLGIGEKNSSHVCINCGADLDRNYRDCPECGNPHVARRRETTKEANG